MSVTFTIEGNPTGRFVLSPACAEPGETRTFDGSDAYIDYEAAVAALTVHKDGCQDCDAYGCYTQAVMDVDGDLDVNVTSVNAAALLGRLGIERDEYGDLVGILDGGDFLGRCLTALLLNDEFADAGVAAAAINAPGSATWIDCGVEPGYFEATLGRLHDLAAEAARLGRCVTWC